MITITRNTLPGHTALCLRYKPMSRTNPYKKKVRAASRTLLMYSEGLEDEVFLKYLRSIYSQNSGVSVKIRNGKGGDPASVVVNASNEPGDYDHRVVVLDNDVSEESMTSARQEAKKRNIELVENTPCLEAVLLTILNKGKSYADKKSAECKKEFESTYLDSKERTDTREYEKVFPKNILDDRRGEVAILNRLLILMEGK